MTRSRLWSFVGLAICALGASAFLGFGPTDAGAGSAVVELRATPPTPAIVEVPVGGVLTWHNDDAVEHRVRSVGHDEEFDSGNLDGGGTYTHTFTRPGTYVYVDLRKETHGDRFGTVVVGSQAAAPADPASPPPGAGAPPAAAGSASVDVRDFAFAPAAITVAVGATVTFHNSGPSSHTATARDGSFDVTIASGASTTATLTRVGTYSYYCKFHPTMVGSITVVAGTGASAAPPATGAATTPSTPPASPTSPAAPSTAQGAGVAATIQDFRFGPGVLHVRVGQRVTWTNRGAVPHSVSAVNGSFDSGILEPGATWAHVFHRKGAYRIVCAVHPQMRATIVVLPRAGAVKPHPRARKARRNGTRSHAKS